MGRHKILIVDDNQELLRLLARLMEAEGLEPIACGRGKEAIKAIAQQPAVAIVDILLPDMMGYDVAATLRTKEIPFVFMTGIFKGGRAASEARLHHGAAGYFEKPFEARKLVEAIRALLPPETPTRVAGIPVKSPPPPQDDDFELELVEPEEEVQGFELTGRVEVQEGGRVSAVIRGESLQAARVAASPQHPPITAPPKPRLTPPDEGELGDSLPELINAFWMTQQTSELAVQRGKVKKVIYFERGRPCFAISNLKADRFGPFLVRVGKLTTPQLELCEAAASMKGRKPADVLVEMGILTDTEKLYFIGQQLKAIAYSLFAWEDGQYRLQFADRATRETTKIDLHPARFIWRGVKKLYRPERLRRLLPDGQRLIPTQQPAYGLHEVEFDPWEAQLLPHVNGHRTVSDLIQIAQKPETAVRALLTGLVALEILDRFEG